MIINSNFNEEDIVANFWGMVESDLLGMNPVVREAMKDATEMGKGLKGRMRVMIWRK